MLPSGPSEPIVKDVKSIKRGLDISWSTDVTSKQEKYLVVYTRNDTKQSVNIETTEKEAKLRELYPGAEYKIQVMAGSENISSDKNFYVPKIFRFWLCLTVCSPRRTRRTRRCCPTRPPTS